ncbi:glycylpeptide N-tetradecanoyltransferase [Cordyceps fumosorosea ARSEF 2679]|uniref:Glycylpeptide N-tetradecanoyltransferase n=1 Tax=Cordyceps fumosorosea (strain ARSEF 2679) TaxID=1081104 RepID=A0A167V5Q0_CORFA|nr:glycylpeptide N-tetradecanoyltransferase [Cordyceps fumosorosea ARSEF 2679]OAA62251.1 glycylpeptide N-tetradecanoyltransferase [Cordyceps fumosorosea ARSEF 2679]
MTYQPPYSAFRAPSLDETLNHPAFPGAKWSLIPDSQGKATVAKDRSGPIDIAWQIHGHGPVKIVLIMGLAASLNAWQRQTCYFGHDHADKYTMLLLDNRGVGTSDKPLARYTTTEMAADVVEVLDQIGWTEPRSIHVIGMSLGGMIAQELACAHPRRLRSLTLLCTTAALESDRPALETLCDRFDLLRPKGLERIIHDTAHRLFPRAWLVAPDEAANLPSPHATRRCGPAPPPRTTTNNNTTTATMLRPNDSGVDLSPSSEGSMAEAMEKGLDLNGTGTGTGGEEMRAYRRFGSNFQRYQAEEMTKYYPPNVFSRQGLLCQLAAVVGHRKSASQLRDMADAVGRERILVLHGTDDRMIGANNGEKLIRMIHPSVGLIVDGMGHAPIMERAAWFNELMETRLAAWSQMD